MDIDRYVDLFWYAEGYYNQVDKSLNPYNEDEYKNFKIYLCTKVFVFPTVLVSYHNLFNLHFVFPKQKMAIQYHLKKDCLNDNPLKASGK